ncbi:MAG: orotidine-5'-phosphate decarboxylase [Candidatus Gracilibacteria bacterium]|nr:orotidine-5'-phosphate decarboxylase [Candidatus Gracilibacteria bacterium]
MTNKASDYLCMALDGFDIFQENHIYAEEFRQRLRSKVELISWVKIGMEVFYSGKVECIEIAKGYGYKVFLDLKLKDIAYDTIKNTSTVLASRGVDLFNVHADGGSKMMKASVEGAEIASQRMGIPRPKIIGVTVLTSMDEKDLYEIGLHSTTKEQVLRLALLAQESGMDGIVCSALDLEYLKPELPEDFIYVTPGIRLPENNTIGQKRIATPQLAFENGSTLQVIGRPLYENKTIVQQVQAAMDFNSIIKELL